MSPRGPASPSGKSVRDIYLSNSEPPAYAGLSGLYLSSSSPAFLKLPFTGGITDSTVLSTFLQRCSLFLISKTYAGVQRFPTTQQLLRCLPFTNTSGPFLCRSWRGAREWVQGRKWKTGDTG